MVRFADAKDVVRRCVRNEDEGADTWLICDVDSGTVRGLVQATEYLSHPGYRHCGIDIAVSGAVRGQRVGLATIDCLRHYLVEVRGFVPITSHLISAT